MRLLLILLSLTMSRAAFAQEQPTPVQTTPPPAAKPATAEAAPPKVVFKKTEKHQFQGSRLKGQLKKPELSYIYQRKGLRAEKIVNVPEKFDDEILRGAGQF